MKTYGQTAYDAYCTATLQAGDKVPWIGLTQTQRDAWNAVGYAVAAEVARGNKPNIERES